ncbi:MAG: leucyl aminopeptidase family protein [Metamycoplasmataceae bacterium]
MKILAQLNKIDPNSFYELIPFVTTEKINKNLSTNKEQYNYFLKEKKVYLFLNENKDYDLNCIKSFFENVLQSSTKNFFINVNNLINKKNTEKEIVSLFVYTYTLLRSKNAFTLKTKKEKIKNEVILATNLKIENFEEEQIIAESISKIKKLQDMPSNILSTPKMEKEIVSSLKENKKINIKVLSYKELKDLGMNLVLAVNAGSANKAKVIVAEYKNNSKTKEKIVLVGKGIIFDSGGYNIKTGKFMLGMKYDMSGAAICAYTLDSIAKLNLNVNVSIVLPLTDNLVDSNATLPESIVKSFSGKTVEIGDTDAEGRLILADGLSYASKELKPSLLIDVATLTGSVVVALGTEYTGVWSTEEKNWKLIEKTAKEVNEKVWRMPLDDKYIEHLSKNTFADMLSWGINPKGGSSDCNMAASWLKQFTLGVPYLHLDIAGTADIQERGQAPMLKTLINFIREYFK